MGLPAAVVVAAWEGDIDRKRAHAVQLLNAVNLFLLRLTLCNKCEPTSGLNCGTNCCNALIASDLEWRNHLGEDHDLAKWNKLVRETGIKLE